MGYVVAVTFITWLMAAVVALVCSWRGDEPKVEDAGREHKSQRDEFQ